jgi:hypothetical protein
MQTTCRAVRAAELAASASRSAEVAALAFFPQTTKCYRAAVSLYAIISCQVAQY